MSIYDKASLVQIPSGYKSGTLYSVVPNTADGDFDFTRGSSATRVNKDGLIETVAANTPRLDYPLLDGVVQDCPALLLEPSRTNLVLRSEELNTTWLTFRSSVTANDIVSPNGSQNAEKIIQESGQTSSGGVYQNLTLSNSTVYTYSVFLKAGGYDFGMIRIDGGQYAWFDLSSGAVGSITGSGSSSIEDFGNGWFRCSFTITTTSTTGQPHIYVTNSDGSQTLSGADGVKGIYAWGAVVEQGSYPTSYIKTTSSQATRSADVCNGAGTSDTFNDSEGVLFVEFSGISSDLTSKRITLNDGGPLNRVVLGIHNVSSQLFYFVSGGGSVPFTQAITVETEQFNKIALKYKSGDTALWINGVEVDTKTNTFTISGLDELSFNDDSVSSKFFGEVKQLMVFNEALSDSELQALTT